jgi:hypothetical protein
MSREQPFFCDRFSREEYVAVSLLRRGFRRDEHYRFPHYEPVLLNPGGHSRGERATPVAHDLGSDDRVQERAEQDFTKARWAFAKNVYARALTDTLNRFSRLASFRWQSGYPNFRFLALAPDFVAAGDFLLERAAQLFESRGRTQAGYFDWESIAVFFHRPTLHQVELLNYWDALPVSTPRDLEMIRRISHLDVEGALALVASGANINALDRAGKTALITLARATPWDHVAMDKDYDQKVKTLPPLTQERRIRMMARLLDAGARINLTFYEQCDALTEAVLAGESETVRFLLSKGADPNYNPWPEEQPAVVSQALRYAQSGGIGRPHRTDAAEDIRAALRHAGAVEFAGQENCPDGDSAKNSGAASGTPEREHTRLPPGGRADGL